MTAKAGVGLGLIPRALVAKHSDELIESSELVRDRLGHLRDEQRREMSIEHAIDLGPRHLDNLLVGEAEVMEKHGAQVPSNASLMSDSTWLACVWATSSGPVCPPPSANT